MRYRVKDYRVSLSADNDRVWLYFTAPQGVELTSDPDNEIEGFIREAIRLVVDEGNENVLCSSMQKGKYLQWAKCNTTTREIRLCFDAPEGKTLDDADYTIEMDWGEEPGTGGGSQLLEEFFNLTEATEYQAATPTEVIDELKELFALQFGDSLPSGFTMPNTVEVDGTTYSGSESESE